MKKVVLGSAVVVAALLLSFGLGLFPGESARVDAAMAEFTVKNMTCASCVGTINEALGKLDGIEKVDIVVTTGRSQVLYDPTRLDAQTIARTITESGFPAVLSLNMSSDDYRSLQAEESRLAETYLARIGSRLISRADFDRKVERALTTMQMGDQPEAVKRVRAGIWQEVRDRALLLTAAESNQIVVPQGEVDLRVKELRASTPDFETALLASYPSQEEFVNQLKEKMIINRNIELNVIAGIDNPQEQRQKLNQWFQELRRQTPMVIFDPQLKQSVAQSGAGGGCGGGCCSG